MDLVVIGYRVRRKDYRCMADFVTQCYESNTVKRHSSKKISILYSRSHPICYLRVAIVRRRKFTLSVNSISAHLTDIERVTERKVKGRKKIHRKKKEFQNASLPPLSFRHCHEEGLLVF